MNMVYSIFCGHKIWTKRLVTWKILRRQTAIVFSETALQVHFWVTLVLFFNPKSLKLKTTLKRFIKAAENMR